MSASLRAPKEIWLGLLYLLVGAAGYFISREYSFGSGARMGPGYFPTIVSVMLVLFGLGAIARAFFIDGRPLAKSSIKIIVHIIGAPILFGLLLDRAGLILAGLALLLVSAAASSNFRFQPKIVFGAIALVATCAFVFGHLLNVPLPWFGSWLRPILPAPFQR